MNCLKATFFLHLTFPPEWDRQPAFKFNMGIDVRLICRLIPRTHELLEIYFFASHFSPEWNRQPAFKFNMDLDVLLIYRLISRTHGLLGYTATFSTTPTSRFLKLYFSFTDAYDMEVSVSGYH
jgi:hypothetical protein